MKPLVSATAVIVTVNDRQLPAARLRGLGEVLVNQCLSLPAQCELTFTGDAAAPGMTVGDRIVLAVPGAAEALFCGEITAIHHTYEALRGRVVKVRGYDRLHRLRKRQPVRAHVQVTLADLLGELVADLGLTVEAADPGPLWQRLMQHRQSDFDLALETAERCGLYFVLRGSTLRVLSLAGLGDPVPLALGDTLLEAQVEINGDPACGSVEAIGWDPHRVERHQGRVDEARIGHAVAAGAAPGLFGESGELQLVDAVVDNDRQAEALAQGVLDRRVAHEVLLWGVAEGDVRLQPGTVVEVSGLESDQCGRYVLTSVTHTIDANRGFISEFRTDPPAPRPRLAASAAAFGVVTRIDDPEQLGRVQVELPSYGGIGTDWLGVLAAGAGAGKGLMTLPDVGDQVLVLLVNGDPAQGIVIGGLYGVDGPPDHGIEGGVVSRFTLLTPGGQRIRLDDQRRSLRLEDRQGSFIELTPDQLTVHAHDARLVLEAPGGRVLIRGHAIDFERG